MSMERAFKRNATPTPNIDIERLISWPTVSGKNAISMAQKFRLKSNNCHVIGCYFSFVSFIIIGKIVLPFCVFLILDFDVLFLFILQEIFAYCLRPSVLNLPISLLLLVSFQRPTHSLRNLFSQTSQFMENIAA